MITTTQSHIGLKQTYFANSTFFNHHLVKTELLFSVVLTIFGLSKVSKSVDFFTVYFGLTGISLEFQDFDIKIKILICSRLQKFLSLDDVLVKIWLKYA